MKKGPDIETVDPPPAQKKDPDDIEKGEDNLEFPGDVRPEWEREDREIEDREPNPAGIEEDTRTPSESV
jgi:hypothetical protein